MLIGERVGGRRPRRQVRAQAGWRVVLGYCPRSVHDRTTLDRLVGHCGFVAAGNTIAAQSCTTTAPTCDEPAFMDLMCCDDDWGAAKFDAIIEESFHRPPQRLDADVGERRPQRDGRAPRVWSPASGGRYDVLCSPLARCTEITSHRTGAGVPMFANSSKYAPTSGARSDAVNASALSHWA
jgi:hypothetical protein